MRPAVSPSYYIYAPSYYYIYVFFKKKRINAYSRVSDTLVELRVGGRFNMFAGKITGGFEDLAHGGHIKCKWRMAHWKPGQVAGLVSACWFSQCILL